MLFYILYLTFHCAVSNFLFFSKLQTIYFDRQGGLSTFFSIVLLGFSQYEFVRKYFFLPFVSVCVVGLLNGLILLPVILSLIGPTAVEICPAGVCSSCSRVPSSKSSRRPRTNEADKDAEIEMSASARVTPKDKVLYI